MKRFLLIGFSILLASQAVLSTSSAKAPSKTVLFVLSSAGYFIGNDGLKHRAGYWLEEFITPYKMLRDEGINVVVATPNGARPIADPGSMGKGFWQSEKNYSEMLEIKKNILDEGPIYNLSQLNELDFRSFDALYFPGGYGPMGNFASNADVGRVLRYFHKHSKTTALVCHGTIALLSAKDGENFPYRGYKVAAYSNSEERNSSLGQYLKTTAEDALKNAGAVYVKGINWMSHVVEDRELISGQNPASAEAVAKAIINRLKKIQ